MLPSYDHKRTVASGFRCLAMACCAAACLLAAPRTSSAQILNLSTGLDASYNLIPTPGGIGGVLDPHWTATTDPTYDPTGVAVTVGSSDADWYGGWLADGPFSDWISRSNTATNNGPAPYTFTDTFSLAGYDPNSATITGSFAIDDEGFVSLNGTQLASVGDGSWGGLTNFAAAAGSGLFLPGTNTLTITISSDDEFLEGVRLQGELFANTLPTSNGTPEPGTLALFSGLTVTGLGYAIRRRRTR